MQEVLDGLAVDLRVTDGDHHLPLRRPERCLEVVDGAPRGGGPLTEYDLFRGHRQGTSGTQSAPAALSVAAVKGGPCIKGREAGPAATGPAANDHAGHAAVPMTAGEMDTVMARATKAFPASTEG